MSVNNIYFTSNIIKINLNELVKIRTQVLDISSAYADVKLDADGIDEVAGASGGQAGEEGFDVQIGGNLGEMLGELLHIPRRRCDALIAAGAGAGLARIEARIAFEELLGRLGDITLDESDSDLSHLPSFASHGYRKVSLSFTVRK